MLKDSSYSDRELVSRLGMTRCDLVKYLEHFEPSRADMKSYRNNQAKRHIKKAVEELEQAILIIGKNMEAGTK